MLSRKQQWRRVRCRRRPTPVMMPQSAPSKLSACDITSERGKSSSASTEKSIDDDVSSSCTALSTWSSFDSVQSVLEDAEVEEDAKEAVRGDGGGDGGALPPSASPAVAAVDVRGKGVTFEPRVQVFLVTHKSELDNRAKQALWWTGRDAAINKKAWLNHLGQPGCGRQSAGQSHRQQQQFHAARTGLYGAGDITASRIGGGGGYGGLSSAYGPSYDPRFLAVGGEGGEEGDREQKVGILGCRCLACLTEGDENEWSPPPPTYQLRQQQYQLQLQQQQQRQQQQQQRQQEELQYNAYAAACYRGDFYSTATASGSGGDRGASKEWPSSEQWEMEGDDLEEMGSLSYSPASSRSDSPMLDAYEGTAYSSNTYFWD